MLVILAACGTPQVTVQPPEVTVQNIPATGDEGPVVGISVSGRGEVTGTPDTLSMNFGVSVLRSSVSSAVADAAALADALIDTLKANGVADEDIQTANYSIYPEYDHSGNRRRLTGFRVNNTVVAKIRDIAAAGAIIDEAAAAAGDEVQINGVSFSIEDDSELIVAAREAAWNDARSKAEQLADLSGVTLGKPITISESFTSQPPMIPFAAFDSVELQATPIEPGQQMVAVNLSVQFAIGS